MGGLLAAHELLRGRLLLAEKAEGRRAPQVCCSDVWASGCMDWAMRMFALDPRLSRASACGEPSSQKTKGGAVANEDESKAGELARKAPRVVYCRTSGRQMMLANEEANVGQWWDERNGFRPDGRDDGDDGRWRSS